jgi:hypothetical protein
MLHRSLVIIGAVSAVSASSEAYNVKLWTSRYVNESPFPLRRIEEIH